MFSDTNEMAMIEGHLNHGIDEMIVGFYEVLEEGKRRKVSMVRWESLKPFVDEYCQSKSILVCRA